MRLKGTQNKISYHKICMICSQSYICFSKRGKFCSKKCKSINGYNVLKSGTRKEKLREFRYSSLENTLLCILWNARTRAKRRKLEFNIKDNEILELLRKQNNKCAMTGVELETTNGSRSPNTISIDRIDPNKGYVLDNVQLVSLIFNGCKNKYSFNDVKDMCKQFLTFNKIKLDE